MTILDNTVPWSAQPLNGMPAQLEIDYLLPHGPCVTLSCSRDDTLQQVKKELWPYARGTPLSEKLLEPSDYIFVAHTLSGKNEELYDERRRLCDLHLFLPVLKLVEPVGNREEKRLNADISTAIARPLAELDDIKDMDNEVLEARCSFYRTVEQIVQERHIDAIDQYALPHDSVLNVNNMPEARDDGMMPIDLWLIASELDAEQQRVHSHAAPKSLDSLTVSEEPISRKASSSSLSNRPRIPSAAVDGVKVPLALNIFTTSPTELISRALTDGGKSERLRVTLKADTQEYFIKVAGMELYLIDDYIADMYRTCNKATLMLVLKSVAHKRVNATSWGLLQPSYVKRHERKLIDRQQRNFAQFPNRPNTLPASMASVEGEQSVSSYAQESFFRIKILSAGYINISDVDEIYVKVGIFHGPELIDARETTRRPPSNPRWEETLNFEDLYIPDMPRAAQICFSLCSIKRRKGKAEEHCAIAWANLRLFTRNDRLLDRATHLNLWPFPHGFEGYLNPLGHNGSNPNWDSSRLEVEFEQFGHDVIFPSPTLVEEYVQTLYKIKRRQNPDELPKPLSEVTFDDREFIGSIIRTNSSNAYTEDVKERVWKLRLLCQSMPESLPRLLEAVRWSSRSYVAQMYMLLKDWAYVTADTALELLGAKYPDRAVHKFAVDCLEECLDDDKLTLYMMPLIQVLRYEAFLDNDLTQFLLRRALKNKRIGHQMFWLLRAELAIAPMGVTTRFTLMLEAYCRGCGPYLASLIKQAEATEKLEAMSVLVKERKEKLDNELRHHQDALENMESPLDSSHHLARLVLKECKALASAKRPLWLAWRNDDALADRLVDCSTHEIIFKNGDDLRQDMLTLQVMRIMDSIWKKEGLDFLLNLYNCLPMGKNIGMIQVVKRSKTFGEIGVMSPVSVNNWLKEYNCDRSSYEAAVHRFTQSCAGYTVATFVLGIADRHPDNIMLTQDGRIFHIDFGHFLGHYKKKLGISRERVPFLLTDEIVTIVAHGDTKAPTKSEHFKRFRELCERAYLTLHRHARLFITLFTMMLCMGIPELQRQEDIDFLRRTLQVDARSEQDALNFFNQQFDLAHKLSYTRKFDSILHEARQKITR